MHQGIAVTTGAPWSTSLDVGRLRVTCATFEPDLIIASHFHDHACLSVIVEGGFHQKFPTAEFECPPGGVIVKPPGERHLDRWGSAPSRHLIVEPRSVPDPDDPLDQVFHDVSFRLDPRTIGISRQIHDELQQDDDLTPLAVQSLALELVVLAGRSAGTGPGAATPPAWLQRARECLADARPGGASITAIAREVGVHPSRLARDFRRHYGLAPGEYARRLRLDRARAALDAGRESISAIALRHGYADQSHLTRDFKRATGVTPAAYRRARTSRG